MNDQRPPSLKDVARIAGVTYQTVSRVINASPNVLPETRARVLAAVEHVGYRPNLAARALKVGRTRLLGVLCIGTGAFETPSTMEGIENAATEAGYAVTFASTRSRTAADVKRVVDVLVDQRVDGIILMAPQTTTDVAALPLPEGLPVVMVEGDPGSEAVGVALKQADGARAATEHLLDLGHETVWHVSGPADWFDSVERQRGWREALEARGREIPPLLFGDWHHQSGYEAGRVLAGIPSVTAVFAANDCMALGAMHALHDAGRSIPSEVSVVGFDDLPEAAHSFPPLTTVRQEFFSIGHASIGLLIRQIEDPGAAVESVRVAPEMVLRSSTAPLSPIDAPARPTQRA